MKVRLRCKKCGYTFETELRTNPLGSLKPGTKSPASKIKVDKDSLDKILAHAQGASREELEKLGLKIEPDEWKDAQERFAIRRFLLDNVRISKERRQTRGERYAISTAPWTMGDSWKDVDLASSEVKSMGVDDLRLIPGVTLQKKVYGITKGRDTEILKGVKFLVLIDASGSMIPGYRISGGKIGKALLIGKDIYELTQKLGFDYELALFSDQGIRIEKKRIRDFWKDANVRASYKIWNGGTRLATGLAQFTDEEYKDSNVIVLSDVDIGDLTETKEKIVNLTRLTNTFKIIVIESSKIPLEEQARRVRDIFPQDINLQVMYIGVEE